MEPTQKEFLLEIGTEEIPAWMMEGALADLKRLLEEGVARFRLSETQPVSFQMYSTPRRLVAFCPNLISRQPNSVETVQGPPKRVAFDAEGNPTQAAIHFAAKMGTKPERLQSVATPKGEYLACRRKNRGKPTREILRELVPPAILGISFPRSMYWEGKSGPRFIRPIRSLLVLYGGRVVPCRIGAVQSGPWTFGHRRLGKPRLRVRNFAAYRETLRENFVLLDAKERRDQILNEMKKLIASENGLRVKKDEELLNTLVHLTEFPMPVGGDFDPSYLSLPEEVLITVMRSHQKYFSVENSEGSLAPRFVAVMNLDADRSSAIRHGHERVLRARFNDARFFWETDVRIPLEQRVGMLGHVTFQSQLGSYQEKAERMGRLAAELARQLGRAELVPMVETAARLAKCDLTTELVKEFTELQGVVGGLYARREGKSEEIATAIYDHYKPQSMEDASPRTPAGAVVSLADRTDTLVGCFGIGLGPSGSKDPLGLRRAGNGVIQILADHKLRLPLNNLAQMAMEIYRGAQSGGLTPSWQDRPAFHGVSQFFSERLRYYVEDVRGFAYDEVNAVLAADDEDVVDVLQRLDAVSRVRPTENFEPLAAAFKRIRNILQQAQKVHGFVAGVLDTNLLEPGPESELYARYKAVSEVVSKHKDAGEFLAALEAIASLRSAIDLFFDKILVMAPQPEVRNNRLTLLQNLLREFSSIADFSEIVVNETRPE